MNLIINARRIVIKLGSALLAKPESGQVNRDWLVALAKDIVALRKDGRQVCVVSSGAVVLGRDILGMERASMGQAEKQAAAACGQMVLMRAWEEVLNMHDIQVAQILLTLDDSESRRRYLNARNTLNTLFHHAVIPIVNENDTVATSEMRVGDNDRLAARVAQMIEADVLLLLSDVDGLYKANPVQYPEAEFIAEVEEIDDKIRSYAAPSATPTGTGGMVTKVDAAAIATASGCYTVVARGDIERPVKALLEGGAHTVFRAKKTPMSARKEWIAGALSPVGTLYADDGAVQALEQGNSLLPVGVVRVSGEFHRGDAVVVKTKGSDMAFAKGLVCYNSDELRRIIGLHSADIIGQLGYERGDVVIHRDDMVML